jgi:hypothetical protein
MATAPLATEYVIARELKALSEVPAVGSIHVLPTQNAFAVWIGISSDNREVRNAIYHFEDDISERYTHVLFDFHVIPVPPGRKMEDFITDAQPLFQRSIA